MSSFSAVKEDSLSDRVEYLLKFKEAKEKHTILIVDDEENNLQLLKRTLRSNYNILMAKNGSDALKIVEQNGNEISLIVSDQRMPEMQGTEFLMLTNIKYPEIIKILLTGNTDTDIIVDSINACHLYQYVLKPFEPEELKSIIETGLKKFELATSKNFMLNELQELFYTTIKAISSALDAKDSYTHGHAARVTLYSLMLATELGLNEDTLQSIETAGLLHDIGKIGVPQSILCKQGKLTNEEFGIMMTHPEQGQKMIRDIKKLKVISNWLKTHHERWDGEGYPDRLKGEQIPLTSRLIALADTYDAMTSTRSYREALAHEVAMKEIARCASTQFDPQLARVFLSIGDKIKQAQQDPEKFYPLYSRFQKYIAQYENSAY